MRRRFYRWLVPDTAIRSIGFVRWRMVDHRDDALAFGAHLAAAFDLPWAAISPAPPDWRPWPTLDDLEEQWRRRVDQLIDSLFGRGLVTPREFWHDSGFGD